MSVGLMKVKSSQRPHTFFFIGAGMLHYEQIHLHPIFYPNVCCVDIDLDVKGAADLHNEVSGYKVKISLCILKTNYLLL